MTAPLTHQHRLAVVALAVALGGALAATAFWQRTRKPQPTFGRDIAPLVFAKCAGCHRPGEAAPFNLLTYDDIRSHARQIVEVTQRGFMPPWLPSEGNETFVGARRLTADERDILKRWVDADAPAGDPSQWPGPPEFADRWQSDPPDLILESPSYMLKSQDRDVFRNFVVSVPFDRPRWIRSIELRPENPRVTHHARLGVDNSSESNRRNSEDNEPGYPGMAWGQDPEGQLVIWAPGMTVAPPTPGVAWRLDPKTSLVLHAHMQPSGKPEIVKFRIGIYFAKQPPEKHPAMLRIGSCDIDIPAGERLHVVEDRFELPIDVDIHTIFPHAHSLCRELRVIAERPDGSRASLIQIDRFDENWHDSYRYQKPVRLPRDTKLVSTFAYDNSDDNPRNRNHPARRVVYGSNAQDEMADVYLQVTAVHADQRAILMEDYKHYDLRSQLVGHRKSLELYPDDPWAQEAVAAAYVGQGEPAKAIPILEGRLKSGPKAVFPVVSLGMALLQSGKADSAEQHLRRATEMDGNYPLAWLGLGKALFAQKKLDGAEPALRRAIELAPSLNDARLALADLLIQRDKLDEAKAICSAVSSEALDMSAVCLKLAEISAKQREYSASLDYCRQAQALAPYTHPPKVLLAVFCVANGDIDRGHALLQDAAAESPQHPMPLLMLGQLARRRQQSRPALEYLTMSSMLPIPDNWPQSHRQRFLVLLHSERFQLAQQINDISLARDALTQWIKCDPSNPQLPKMLSQLPAK